MIGFGKFGKKRNLEISLMSDELIVKVDPTREGFYDNILNHYTIVNGDIKEFIDAVCEVKKAGIAPFYKPVMDPSIEGSKVVYKKEYNPATGYSYNWWVEIGKAMPAVEGKSWNIGSEYQYYAFLVDLINRLVDSRWKIESAVEAVAIDSKELGHYLNSENAKHNFETTGSRKVIGSYDLANTFKLLSCTNKEAGGFWRAGGFCYGYSNKYPLARLDHVNNVDNNYSYAVGWFVLS